MKMTEPSIHPTSSNQKNHTSNQKRRHADCTTCRPLGCPGFHEIFGNNSLSNAYTNKPPWRDPHSGWRGAARVSGMWLTGAGSEIVWHLDADEEHASASAADRYNCDCGDHDAGSEDDVLCLPIFLHNALSPGPLLVSKARTLKNRKLVPAICRSDSKK